MPKNAKNRPPLTVGRHSISKKERKKKHAEQKPGAASSAAQGGASVYRAQALTLLLGEGDFGFAAALALIWHDARNLVASTYDNEEAGRAKYSHLPDNVKTVESLGGNVLFGVDATKCGTHKKLKKGAGSFERIVFNFPHVGTGMKDMARNVAQNQELMRSTFRSALPLLAPSGELHVTLKKGQPYDSWNIVTIAKMCGLAVRFCAPFAPGKYPGYAHRRNIGDEHAGDASARTPNAEIQGARTYAFVAAQ